jgi:hypothetical protein
MHVRALISNASTTREMAARPEELAARRPARWFYVGMALACVVTIFSGFAPSFYLRPWAAMPDASRDGEPVATGHQPLADRREAPLSLSERRTDICRRRTRARSAGPTSPPRGYSVGRVSAAGISPVTHRNLANRGLAPRGELAHPLEQRLLATMRQQHEARVASATGKALFSLVPYPERALFSPVRRLERRDGWNRLPTRAFRRS